MAIGTAAAIGIGLAGVGSAVSASANRSAANRAAQTSEQGTAQSLALQRESRDMALQRLDPFIPGGVAATNTINALLGIGGQAPQFGGGQPVSQAASQFTGGRSAAEMWGLGEGLNPFGQDLQINPEVMPWMAGQMGGGAFFAQNPDAPMQVQMPAQGAQQAARSAFDTFRNSTGYQFRVNEAQNALNSGFAGSGLLQSGAALRGLDELRQNMASAEFGNFMAYLGQQQNVGLGAASATAGVGQNFAANAGNLVMQNAANQANAQIARAQNNPFANALGTLGGATFGFGVGR